MIDVFWGELLVSPTPLEMSLSFCSHHCAYCFSNLNDPKRTAKPKAIMSLLQNFRERKTLVARLLQEGYPVCVSNRTDPFATSNYQMAVPILKTMTELGIPVVIQTKGGKGIDEVLDFLPPSVWYISVSFWDDDLRRKIEPGAPTLDSRFELMRQLTQRGHHVTLGLNPIVPEWLANPTPVLKAARDAGATGAWIETLHLNRDQEANLTDRERKVLTQPLIDRGKKRVKSSVDLGAFFQAREIAQRVGLETFSIGQPNRSEYFAPYRKCYPKTFPTMQDFINSCHDKVRPLYDVIPFSAFADFMAPDLPQGVLDIGHYIGATAHNVYQDMKISNLMTYRQLLEIIWKEKRTKQCPARMPCFAFAGQEEDDGWIELTDDGELPYLVFSKQNLDGYYVEIQTD